MLQNKHLFYKGGYMKELKLPYGRGFLKFVLPEERLAGVLESHLHDYEPPCSPDKLVATALENPIGTPQLRKLAEGKNRVVIIASDHTRPVPSRQIIPAMLREIRCGNSQADITILIATGCHRGTTRDELIEKFGEEIVNQEKIIVHDCDDNANMVSLGTLPSGGELLINRIAVEADLLCAEGFIEPHFFAGFSGGRKSVLPGIASRKTVLADHCSAFIDSPFSRTGILEGNPIHRDMLFAAKEAKLAFIVNVVLDSNKQIIHAVSGDCDLAHQQGVQFLDQWCRTDAVESDIAVVSNGGYPLDQNIYQAVKGMTAAEATVKEGGVIIMAARSEDGHGGKVFYETFRDEPDEDRLLKRFISTPADQTIPDQWQSQIFARVLKRAHVIYVSEAPSQMVRDLHMIPASTLEEALQKADSILGKKDAGVTVIPDGVSVIVKRQADPSS